MEYKIGEIFEYNGEWYQCIKNDNCRCGDCDFDELGDCDNIACISGERSDDKEVYFKKLEKVGEPLKIHNRLVLRVKADAYKCINCCFYSKGKCELTMQECEHYDCGEENKFIEIKQNKEDMEEKKQCGDNRFITIARAKEHLFQATNIAEDKKELEVLDSFLLRCWQMGWLKQYEDAEESKLALKSFDLEAAKADKPVCTRTGKKVRIVCFDKIGTYPIIALVQEEGTETCHFYSQDGKCADCGSEYDLMMLCEKKKGYVNVYSNIIHATLEDADEVRKNINNGNYLYTLEVEWEE